METTDKTAGILPRLQQFDVLKGIDADALQWLIDRAEYRCYEPGDLRPYRWLDANILRNGKGCLETGKKLALYPGFRKIWKLDRDPFLLETCRPGIFAAGDVRAGAMNRVASAVGEGAMAIKYVHEYLAEV